MQHVMCHLVRRDSSAVKSDRVEIAFILALFYWLKPLNNEGGEETRVPGEKPNNELQKMPQTKAKNFKPQPRLEPHTLALVAGLESRHVNHHTTHYPPMLTEIESIDRMSLTISNEGTTPCRKQKSRHSHSFFHP